MRLALFRCVAALALLPAGAACAESFRDCAECPEMLRLPAGTFRMGASDRPGQGPERDVSLRSFAIGRYEVTQGEWKALMGSNPSRHVACGDNCPVEQVSWQEAQAFIQRLREKTGKQYRLPSEVEWEYACRAGQDSDWCGGNDFPQVAWGGKRTGPQPVGGRRANAWGLYDMSGNVWEWTQDCAHPDYRGAPDDGTAWESGGDCTSRILRGGSWLSGPQYARIGIRMGWSASYRTSDFGFRVAISND